MLFQPVDPFPDPSHAGQEIEFVGVMFACILMLILMMVLMIYAYKKMRRFLPVLIIFLFSIIMGINTMSVLGFPHTPWFQLFFILFQTIIFYYSVLELQEKGDFTF